MATQTLTRPEQDQTVEKKTQQLRQLYADAPEVGKKALHALSELTSQVSKLPAMGNAGRAGSRQGTVSELTVIALRTRRSQAAARVAAVAERHTIEFLQQEWVNDGNFMGLDRERDPIIGRQDEGATFTIPREPVRRRIHGIETFNVLRGGEYFFMPSIGALNWLANLSG